MEPAFSSSLFRFQAVSLGWILCREIGKRSCSDGEALHVVVVAALAPKRLRENPVFGGVWNWPVRSDGLG